MPIKDVEIVTCDGENIPPELPARLVDELGGLFGSAPGFSLADGKTLMKRNDRVNSARLAACSVLLHALSEGIAEVEGPG